MIIPMWDDGWADAGDLEHFLFVMEPMSSTTRPRVTMLALLSWRSEGGGTKSVTFVDSQMLTFRGTGAVVFLGEYAEVK